MNEVAELQAEVERLRAALAKATADNVTLERQNTSLLERLNIELAKRYGPSSERVDESQLSLFNEAEADVEEEVGDELGSETPTAASANRPTPRRRGKRALPEELERIEVRHELAEDERQCPHDGATLAVIGEQASEQLDIVPAKVRVLRHVQVKYACPRCREHAVTAPKPHSPIPGSQVSPGLLAHVAISKYLDHWPLYRQGQVFERMGAVMHRSTMSQWMRKAGALVQPLINLLEDETLAQPYLHMDETTVQVLKEPGKTAESQSYMWVRVSGNRQRPVVLFDYDPTRSREVPRKLLAGFSGVIQCDGYSGYDAAIGEYGLLSAGCWAHARRRFDEVFKAAGINPNKPIPKRKKPPTAVRKAAFALQRMKTLFAIEHRLRDASVEQRKSVRQQDSAPIVAQLRLWLDETRPVVAPKTKLGLALGYLDRQWPRLTVFLAHGEVEMTNNIAENAIRPFAVGRKNWLFSDSQAGARSSANIYGLLQTAKANNLEPYGYLKYIFEQLPQVTEADNFETLLPWNVDRHDIIRRAI